MTKIAIQPNASGTGTFTIAAPNSNVDRTFSLPDATGEVLTSAGGTVNGALAVNGNLTVDTNTLFVDAVSNNVGVGTSSPTDTNGFTRALDLNGVNGAAYYARTNGSATNVTLFSNFGSDGYVNNVGAGNLRFYNNGNVERMTIDSAGRVTMPYQPAFMAVNNAANYTGTSVIVWNTVYVNRGSHYNSANGRFTAPIAGVYAFHYYFLKRQVRVAATFLRVNGSAVHGNANTYTDNGNDGTVESMNSVHALVNLNAGDYVEVLAEVNSGDIYGLPNGHNGFCGHLIG